MGHDPKAEVRWKSVANPKADFVVTLENLILCAVTSGSEAEFRTSLYAMGMIEETVRAAKDRKDRKVMPEKVVAKAAAGR